MRPHPRDELVAQFCAWELSDVISIAPTSTPSYTGSPERALFAKVSMLCEVLIKLIDLKGHLRFGQESFLPRGNGSN
jgi:hypothetical protein